MPRARMELLELQVQEALEGRVEQTSQALQVPYLGMRQLRQRPLRLWHQYRRQLSN